MSLARTALVAGALAVASFAAPSHAVTVCTAQTAGWAACADTDRPGCVYGGSTYATFMTVFCAL